MKGPSLKSATLSSLVSGDGHSVSEEMRFSLEPLVSVDDIEPLWKELDRFGDHSFFLTWTWISTWLKALPSEYSAQLLTARHADRAVGAAVLVPRKARRHALLGTSQLHFNSTGERQFDCITIEHNGFAGPTGDHQLWRRLADWFGADSQRADELIIPGVEQAVVNSLPSEDPLFMTSETSGFRTRLLDAADGGLEAGLSRNARQQLRRSKRDYRLLGELRIDEAADLDSALEYFQELKDLHIASWTRRGKAHAFRFPFFERFHRALIARGMAERSVQLLRITAGVHVIGFLYNFRHRGRIYAYQSGFDDLSPARRPGYVCHALAMELNA